MFQELLSPQRPQAVLPQRHRSWLLEGSTPWLCMKWQSNLRVYGWSIHLLHLILQISPATYVHSVGCARITVWSTWHVTDFLSEECKVCEHSCFQESGHKLPPRHKCHLETSIICMCPHTLSFIWKPGFKLAQLSEPTLVTTLQAHLKVQPSRGCCVCTALWKSDGRAPRVRVSTF